MARLQSRIRWAGRRERSGAFGVSRCYQGDQAEAEVQAERKAQAKEERAGVAGAGGGASSLQA